MSYIKIWLQNVSALPYFEKNNQKKKKLLPGVGLRPKHVVTKYM